MKDTQRLYLSLLKKYDLSDFYAITLWESGNIVLQGKFTPNNLFMANSLGIKMAFNGTSLRGASDSYNVNIVLTT